MLNLPMPLVRALDRFSAAHPWDHNAHYHRAILRALHARTRTALDVGCGSGDLARRLAGRAGHVTAIDADPGILERAREATPPGVPVTFGAARAPEGLPPGPFDVVTCVAALHHLPFTAALEAFRERLAPGGTLVVVGCYRAESRSDDLIDVVAIPGNVLVGLLKHRLLKRRPQKHRPPASRPPLDRPVAMTAPTRPAEMSFPEILREAARVLPGVRARRRLFWRYVMVWTAPEEGQGVSSVTENAKRSPR